ncbi:type IV inositol polyphosphate 5-phosphatase 7-like [Zingiber officinale]|uniref:type IV inositol polyphosphate 5-phosphatase 7-like n=1 Tax=Zingiber officinale TaxID=94328 RepID=UPI001C4D955A|nr:type IV inositol polyphosphate 5-phosphatase 7-like [Zingiber officinale]
MRDERSVKSKLSWTKKFVKKWLNVKGKFEGFQSHSNVGGGGDICTERETFKVNETIAASPNKPSLDRVGEGRFEVDLAQATCAEDYKVFVSTWNVGGKSPSKSLNLEGWLLATPPADIYVLGFQEIVPLNAGNVLGAEDKRPAKKWLALIRKTLNSLPGTYSCGSCSTPSPVPNPLVELDVDFENSSVREKSSSFMHRCSLHSLSRSLRIDSDTMVIQPWIDRRYSVCDRVSIGSRPSDFDPCFISGDSSDDEKVGGEPLSTASYSPASFVYGAQSCKEERSRSSLDSSYCYCLITSKQMVGIFLTIWARDEIRDSIQNLKVSCVGRGLMGYLGNKGSISISMTLQRTSFCFVCSHLTSGEKEGDQRRRNLDVLEILRKTRFPRIHSICNEKSPETILEHDRVIWLGDLNYRIALSYQSAKALVEMCNWRSLLEKDQLRIAQRRGHVFDEWKEGNISFPPTYKYSNNSDRYTSDGICHKEKRRTPAWCDRILWYGRGLTQSAYVRGESRFSDHRPVYGMFNAEVTRIKNNTSCSNSHLDSEEF